MVPAVYYAHLASNRAMAHLNKPTISSGKKEYEMKKKKAEEEKAEQEGRTLSSSDKPYLEIPPLIDLNNSTGLLQTMWFI